MSTTLNLADHLIVKARHLQNLGLHGDALRILKKLSSFRRLPQHVAVEAQTRLAETYLDRLKFRKARRHLTAALAHHSGSARHHYLMAQACCGDDNVDKQRAAHAFQTSLDIDPNQPDCLSQYGLLLVELGRAEEGFRYLHRAIELAPDDPDPVQKLAQALEETGQFDEISRVLQAALFRNPRDARFRRMWNDYQFDRLWREQAHGNRAGGETEGPVVLPFTRPALKIVRRDESEPLALPHQAKKQASRRQA
jgi:tetratricopeptide (TPR) repeat protein